MRARVHVVSSRNRELYSEQIEQHFRIRHEIYVGERGWQELARSDGREIDQFDTDETIYLLALEGEKVIGGSRLNPTMKPHLISDVFPHLAPKGVMRGYDILEWTRIFVVKEYREEFGYARVGSELMCAIIEYCIAMNISAVTALIDAWWLPRFLECGWQPEPLGLPTKIDGSPALVVALFPTKESLQKTRNLRNIDYDCLVDTDFHKFSEIFDDYAFKSHP